MRLSFTVPGQPVPLQRARKGRNGWYTPVASRDYKEHIAWHALEAKAKLAEKNQEWRLDGEYGLRLWAYCRDARRRDWSNILKAVEDALIGVLWLDDSQIIDYASSGLRMDPFKPRVEITAWLMEENGKR